MAIMSRGGTEEFGDINITPLTDVFLILFLIMIVIAPMIQQSALTISPPKAQHGKATSSQGKVINVEIAANGLIAVNGNKLQEEPLAPEEVMQAVTDKITEIIEADEAYKEVPVNVIADAETKQKFVVGVLDAAAGLGIKKMNIVTVSDL